MRTPPASSPARPGPSSTTSSATSTCRPTSATAAATASPPAPSASWAESEEDGHAHKCTLCYDRQKDGLTPACAKACPTASIQFGPVDKLREHARERVQTLNDQGNDRAYLYGADPLEGYGTLNSFFLLEDHPNRYNLPERPPQPLAQAGQALRGESADRAGPDSAGGAVPGPRGKECLRRSTRRGGDAGPLERREWHSARIASS